MTDEELIAYFEHAKLPDKLRIDRATTQHQVQQAVYHNIEILKSDSTDARCRNRLNRIAAAMEHPYDGPEIPRF